MIKFIKINLLECLSICQTCSNSSSCDTCKVAGTNPILDCTCPSIFYRDGAGICQCIYINLYIY